MAPVNSQTRARKIGTRLRKPAITVGIVLAEYHGRIARRLLEGALKRLDDLGVRRGQISVLRVPGAYEVPAALAALARRKSCRALVALGCVIRGETSHYDHVCQAAALGSMQVSLASGKALGFGILTVNTLQQALRRSDPSATATGADRKGKPRGASNKGAEAAETALRMARLLQDAAAGL